jgi:excisionase family DNA binding protein
MLNEQTQPAGGENNTAGLSKTWYTQEEAAAIMKVSVHTIKKYRYYKGLRYSKMGGIIRINEDDIQEFWRRHRK